MIYLLAALATWRVTHILLRENGPWGLFQAARVRLGVAYYADGSGRVAGFKYEITVCMWCLSVWTGIAATCVLWLAPITVQYVLFLPFAISAACVIVDHYVGMK